MRRSILTPRQREVAQLLTEGHGTKEIARMLNISLRTADVHVTDIRRRLRVHNRIGIVRFMTETKWLKGASA